MDLTAILLFFSVIVVLLAGFPVAFTLNRLGQHYRIDPSDPRKWSTRVDGNPAWHFLFLWSNHHIEHHYYPRVPFYNLRKLDGSQGRAQSRRIRFRPDGRPCGGANVPDSRVSRDR